MSDTKDTYPSAAHKELIERAYKERKKIHICYQGIEWFPWELEKEWAEGRWIYPVQQFHVEYGSTDKLNVELVRTKELLADLDWQYEQDKQELPKQINEIEAQIRFLERQYFKEEHRGTCASGEWCPGLYEYCGLNGYVPSIMSGDLDILKKVPGAGITVVNSYTNHCPFCGADIADILEGADLAIDQQRERERGETK